MSSFVAVLCCLTLLCQGGIAAMGDTEPTAAMDDTEPAPAPVMQGWAMSSLSKDESALETSPPMEDKAWALKRDWTDTEFQEGAEINHARLQEYEDILMSRLRSSFSRTCSEALLEPDAASTDVDASDTDNVLARVLEPTLACQKSDVQNLRFEVLNQPEILGSALDIVGAYLKNYEVDKAAAVIETVLPVVRARGGLWLLKALNHLATVRMKQARPSEALECLEEVEAYVNQRFGEEERDDAWEFWETTYRNFAWVLSSLDREQEALDYVQKAVDVKERVGKPATWFDLWDLGRMKAVAALKQNNAGTIKAAQAIVTKALWLHKEAEPSDLVMRAKIWHTVGECSFALGHLAEDPSARTSAPNGPVSKQEAQGHYKKALKCFKESHKLFKKTEGRYNPLTGSEAEAVAWSMLKLGIDTEAKEYLLDALETASRQQNAWGDGGRVDLRAPALSRAMETVDRVLEVHRRTDDREGLAEYFTAIERLCQNICSRLTMTKDHVDAVIYERLISSSAMVMVASGLDEGTSRGQKLLRAYLWDQPSTQQAQLCAQMLLALPDAPRKGMLPGSEQPGAQRRLPRGDSDPDL